MKHIETLSEVPLKKSAIYDIARRSLGTLFHPNITWTELSVRGRKGFLNNRDIKNLGDNIMNDTMSGESLGFSRIKKRVHDAIIDKYRKEGNLDLLPEKISNDCLLAYVDKIRSQSVFLMKMSVLDQLQNLCYAVLSLLQ